MKILLIHQQFLGDDDPGGSRFNQFAKYWSELGHEVTVLAGMVNYATGHKNERYRGKFVVKEQIEPNITVYRCFIYSGHSSNFLGRVWRFLTFAYSSLIAGLLKSGKQDVILVTSPPLLLGLTGHIIGFFKRIPLIFEVRDLWPESAIETGMMSNRLVIKLSFWLEKLIYARAAKINGLTPAINEAILNKGVPDDKLVYVPNGADFDLFSPGPRENWVREQYGWGDKYVVLYMGAHGIANHLWQILDAAKLLEDHNEIFFVLVGSGVQKPQLIERAQQMNLRNLQFIEPQPKRLLANFTNAADVCTAVLMNQEVFKTVYPNKIFDYMSCEKPIIIGIDGAARKLVEDAQAGEFAPPEDAQALSELVLKFYKNRKLAEEYGKNGYRYAKEHFSRERLANDYLEILKTVTGKSTKRDSYETQL